MDQEMDQEEMAEIVQQAGTIMVQAAVMQKGSLALELRDPETTELYGIVLAVIHPEHAQAVHAAYEQWSTDHAESIKSDRVIASELVSIPASF